MSKHKSGGFGLGRVAIALSALVALAGCGDGAKPGKSLEPLGLYTSLPILWRETGELSGLLDSDAPRHWALDVLEEHGNVRPLDSLAGPDGTLPLARGALLVMAQPRPLAPDENVALDEWVRSGGRVLLFADPMLTAESDYALGDKRRPQDVVLLSPILAHWGLELQFDEEQPAGEHSASLLGDEVTVNLPGRFVPSGNSRECTLLASGLAARCQIGAGRVLALADAAMLEEAAARAIPLRAAALERLIASLESRD
ncbi:MAG: ABC transporter [Novosphingobium sp.]|nr:ABC transporter [Novosphingobium sp.]